MSAAVSKVTVKGLHGQLAHVVETVKTVNQVRRDGFANNLSSVFKPFMAPVGQDSPVSVANSVASSVANRISVQNAQVQATSQKVTHLFCCCCCCTCDYSSGQQAPAAAPAPQTMQAAPAVPENVMPTLELPPRPAAAPEKPAAQASAPAQDLVPSVVFHSADG